MLALPFAAHSNDEMAAKSDFARSLGIPTMPLWDGHHGTSADFYQQFQTFTTLKGAASLLFAEEFGLTPPDGQPKATMNALVFAMLQSAISPSLFRTLCDAAKVADAVALKGDAEHEEGSLFIKFDAAKLWAAVLEHGKGDSRISDAALRRDLAKFRWVDDPQKSLRDQVDLTIRKAADLRDRAAQTQVSFSELDAVSRVVDARPRLLTQHERVYNQQTTLVDLQLEMTRDAVSLDEQPEILALFAGGGAASTKPKFTHARRLDESAGPTYAGSIFCPTHGWGPHDAAHCKNPAVAQATALLAAMPTGTPLFKQLPNGDFQRVL